MKKFIVMVCLSVFATGAVFAQGTQNISTDPIDLLNHKRVNVRYERMLTKGSSFTAEVNYDYNYADVYGFNLGASYRFYLRKLFPIKTKNVEGLFVGPYARLGFYTYTANAANTTSDLGVEIGGEIGYKVVFPTFYNISVEPIIRLGMGISGPSYYNKDFTPSPGVSIGYTW